MNPGLSSKKRHHILGLSSQNVLQLVQGLNQWSRNQPNHILGILLMNN